ncbi:hypothetical protein WDU94_004423 [Cyamophila willieti]
MAMPMEKECLVDNETKSSAGCDDKIRGYYRNPYINYYVRLFDQKEFKGKPAREVAKYAGQSWRNMQETEKQTYRDMTKMATQTRKRSKVGKNSRRGRNKPARIQIALRIKQERTDENNNEETSGTSSTEQTDPDTNSGTYVTASEPSEQCQLPVTRSKEQAECAGESYDKTETCENAETQSTPETLVDNSKAVTDASYDAIQPEGSTDTTWHCDSEDTPVCHDFNPLPPTPIPSECTQRVCVTPRQRRGKRGREEESPPPAPKRSKAQDRERTAPHTSPTEMTTPKRSRNTDIHDVSTLKKASKNKERESKRNRKREKKQSVKRKLSFSSDSESVYSFEPRSKRKRITTGNQSDDEFPQNRNNDKRKFAKVKARKQSKTSSMKRKKQGEWYLNSSDETASDSE